MIVVHGLIGRPIAALEHSGSNQAPVCLQFETDTPVDDIVVTLIDGSVVYFQCKRKCGKGQGLAKALEQFVHHVDANGFDDRLVIAAAELTGPIKALPSALRKRRAGGTLSTTEKEAIAIVRAKLSSRPKPWVDEFLNCIHCWKVDAADDISPDFETAVAWLEGQVVRSGEGNQAIAIVKDQLHRLASVASGTTVSNVWSALRDGGLDLQTDREGNPAQRLSARAEILGEYSRIIAANKDLITCPLSTGVRKLHVDGLLDSIRTHVEDDGKKAKNTPENLLDVVRRYRKLILHGTPGAGKTTAVEQLAAHLAADPDAPTPVIVRLRKLARFVDAQSDVTLDLILDCADISDLPNLKEILRDMASTGSLFIIYDGADECRSKLEPVLNGISMLDANLGANGWIVTTRPSVLTKVRTLGLPDVRLAAPNRPRSIPQALLREIAKTKYSLEDDPSSSSGKIWLEQKLRELEFVFDRTSELSQVPLLGMTITVIISDDLDLLGTSTTSILERAIDSAIREWERQRLSGTLIEHDNGTITPEILFDGFISIGRALALNETVSTAAAISDLSHHLSTAWGENKRVADAIARDIVEFWDARMSIFISGPDGTIEARSQQFVELADALWVTNANVEDKRRWTKSALADNSLSDTVALAVEKSTDIAQLLLEESHAANPALFWVAEAGSRITLPAETIDGCLSQLKARLDGLHDVISEQADVDWDRLTTPEGQARRDGVRWPIMLLTARLRCSVSARFRRDEIVELAQPGEKLTVARATAAITDATVDGRDLSPTELSRLREALALPIPPTPEPQKSTGRRQMLSLRSGEPLLTGRIQLVVDALRFIEQFDPQIASLADEYALKATMGPSERIRSALENAGYPVKQFPKFSMPAGFFRAPDGRSLIALEIACLAGVSETVEDLNSFELWWATEALQLIDLLDLGSASIANLEISTTGKESVKLTSLAVLFCEAAMLDRSKISAIVTSALAKGDPALKKLAHLGFVTTPAKMQIDVDTDFVLIGDWLSAITNILDSQNDFIHQQLCRLLWDLSYPDLSMELVRQIRKSAENATFWDTILAFRTAQNRSETFDTLMSLGRDDVARSLAAVLKNETGDEYVSLKDRVLLHDDLRVRLTLDDTSAIYLTQPSYWSCLHCDSRNPVDIEDCEHCDEGVRPLPTDSKLI